MAFSHEFSTQFFPSWSAEEKQELRGRVILDNVFPTFIPAKTQLRSAQPIFTAVLSFFPFLLPSILQHC